MPSESSETAPERTVQLADGHPLSGKEHLLDTHEGQLEAYAEVLQEADPDDVHGVMLVMYSAEGADTFPSVSVDVDPRWASLWMLGNHIHHVATSAQESGGTASMEGVATDAIEYVRHHGIGGDTVSSDRTDRALPEHGDRVLFADGYDDMSDEIAEYVGLEGLVVAGHKHPMSTTDDRTLVHFNENPTGRSGGPRYWVRTDRLEITNPKEGFE